eukprot:3283520-Rhodomonas_salina.1
MESGSLSCRSSLAPQHGLYFHHIGGLVLFCKRVGVIVVSLVVLTMALSPALRHSISRSVILSLTQPPSSHCLCRWLVSDARAGDNLFMHYSGHGGSMPDDNGDEEDGMDETMVPVDYQRCGSACREEGGDMCEGGGMRGEGSGFRVRGRGQGSGMRGEWCRLRDEVRGGGELCVEGCEGWS